jgi:hypothetical protein
MTENAFITGSENSYKSVTKRSTSKGTIRMGIEMIETEKKETLEDQKNQKLLIFVMLIK